MATYLIRVVKSNSVFREYTGRLTVHEGAFDAKQTVDITTYTEPKMFQSHQTNEYLITLENDRIETLRYIVNTIIEAEGFLLPNFHFPFVLVYPVELGEKIDTETQMFMLFPMVAHTRDYVPYDFISETRGLVPRPPRQTWRGSGRYEPIKVVDPPARFYQHHAQHFSSSHVQIGARDQFIGLNVAFGRIRGRALKRLYVGGVNANNYSVNQRGILTLHRRGTLYAGQIQNFRKRMSLVAHFFAHAEFDADGVLVEASRVVDKPMPLSITELSAQRRAAHTVDGASAEVKRRILMLMLNFYREWLKLYDNVSKSVHNLNYSVEGWENTRTLYEKSERILRVISAYFPEELTFDQSKVTNASRIEPVAESKQMKLGNKANDAGEVWDCLVRYVEWMRQNYVDYEPMNTEALEENDCSRKPMRIMGRPDPVSEMDWRFKIFGGGDGETVTLYSRFSVSKKDQYFWDVKSETYYHYGKTPNGKRDAYTTPIVATYSVYQTHFPGMKYGPGWSDNNVWLEKTRGTAADIEQSFLTFQTNSRHFISLLAHFESVCNPVAHERRARIKGTLPGEIVRTREQELNRNRVHPRTKNADDVTSLGGDLNAPTNQKPPFPHLCPLQCDLRPIIKRCARDEVAADDYDPEAEERERQEKDAEKLREELDEMERKRKKQKPKREMKWRSEIDPIDADQLEFEKGQMYEQIVDNLLLVETGISAVVDTIAVLGTGGAATPLVAAKHVAKETGKETGKRYAKKLLRELAEEAAKEALDRATDAEEPDADDDYDDDSDDAEPDDPEVPEHDYDPPDLGDDPEHTGDEEYSRDDCAPEGMVLVAPWSGELYVPVGSPQARLFPPNNGIDLGIIELFEKKLGKRLRQKGLRKFDDRGSVTGIQSWTEMNSKERLRCVREPPRLPRA